MRPSWCITHKTFDDKVRTFCWNPRGEVSEERYDQLAVANGHSYKDEKYKTTNTNFALLVSKHFTHPFNTPIQYGRHIAELGNMLSGNKVMVQRYGDLKRGRRTNQERHQEKQYPPDLEGRCAGGFKPGAAVSRCCWISPRRLKPWTS